MISCSGALIYSTTTHRVLLLQKAYGRHTAHWVLCGGTNYANENPWQGLVREIEEELGFIPDIKKTLPLEKFVSNDTVFHFHTYLCIVEEEFIPIMSEEHIAWGWFDINFLPKPLHKGLDLSLRSKIIRTKIQSVIEILDLAQLF